MLQKVWVKSLGEKLGERMVLPGRTAAPLAVLAAVRSSPCSPCYYHHEKEKFKIEKNLKRVALNGPTVFNFLSNFLSL